MRLNIWLDLTSQQVRDRLLPELDRWIALGLLSEAQITEIAESLSEPLPAAIPQYVSPEYAQTGHAQPELASTSLAAGQEIDQPAASSLASPQRPNRLAQAFGALVEEISVLWLLFLGVFLVVVSSGVLAASQWSSFSAVGQYAVLFAYTLAFGLSSLWALRQENLQSTGRMLALTMLLLIPVNFWMMDRFGIFATLAGKGIGIVAAIVLTGLPLGLSATLMPRRVNRLNLVGLSWLHWGWGFALWPVLATYIGTIGTAALLVSQDWQTERSEAQDAVAESPEPATTASAQQLSFDVLAVGLSVLILLVRSLLIAQVPPYQLGMAAGICGWLLAWLTRTKASRQVWERAGLGLMALGWVVSVGQSPPLQAIAVSLLAISLVGSRLRQTWQRGYLLAVLAIALQAYGLIWSVVPTTLRDRLLILLSSLFEVGNITSENWASIGFFPFLLGTLAFAFYLRRQQQRDLATRTEQIALGFGAFLSLLSLGNSFTTAVNLSLSGMTLVWLLTNRRNLPNWLTTLTHVLGLTAAVSWIYYVAPDLNLEVWGTLALGAAIAELIYHPFLRSRLLKLETWGAGLVLAVSGYILLLSAWEFPSASPPGDWRSLINWIWLSVPIALTFVTNHRRSLEPQTAAKVMLLTLLMQTPWMLNWPVAIATFCIGVLGVGLNSRVWRSGYAAFAMVASGILLASSLLWTGLIEGMENSAGRMLIFWAIEIWSLWLIQRGLARRGGEMSALYERATRRWGALLMAGLLLWGSFVAAIILEWSERLAGAEIDYVRYLIAAVVLLISALAECIRYRPNGWRYWSLAWAVEVVVVLGCASQGVAIGTIGIATIALGFAVQILADVWVLKHPPYRNSWHYIPLGYAGLGLCFGHVIFQADSGLYTLAAGLLCLGIGRREPALKFFSYLGLIALSAGAYELLIYRLLQAEGGTPGDGYTLLAMLALGLTMLYRAFGHWTQRYLQISTASFQFANHGHYLLGSVLCVIAGLEGLSQPRGIALWTVTSLLLSGYALSVGNRRWTPAIAWLSHKAWTWLGLVGLLLCIAYDRYLWFPDRTALFTWGGAIACFIGIVFYYLPWERLGWASPWRVLGLVLPALTLSITLAWVQTQGLLLVAAFYAWMAKQTGRVRLSYLSVVLFDLALIDFLDSRGWLTATGLSLVGGLSVLYVAEVEPYFRHQERRQQRHWLRTFATGLVGLTALYQAEISEPMLLFAAVAIALGIAFVFAGLILKVRAFLYVGTATFILQILRVMWLFVNSNSLLLWAVGIVLGLVFIWVAATFESRRSQITQQLSSWTAALETWD
ncbi:MAG: hypothetical protein AAFR18_09685 [Cyanobacteria bacterium J06627_32]